jgi:membrane protein DedA with SNARE-associated domain
MRYRTFLPWNAIGGIAWGGAAVMAGYVAGVSYQRVEKWLGAGAAGVVAAVVVVGLIVWQVRKRRHERHTDEQQQRQEQDVESRA